MKFVRTFPVLPERTALVVPGRNTALIYPNFLIIEGTIPPYFCITIYCYIFCQNCCFQMKKTAIFFPKWPITASRNWPTSNREIVHLVLFSQKYQKILPKEKDSAAPPKPRASRSVLWLTRDPRREGLFGSTLSPRESWNKYDIPQICHMLILALELNLGH